MAVKNQIQAIPLTTLNAAGLGAYQAINGPNGLPNPCIILRINNNSNTPIFISFDGVTDHEYISANDNLLINAQTNALPKPDTCEFKKGLIVYVRGAAGVGTLSVAGYFQPNNP